MKRCGAVMVLAAAVGAGEVFEYRVDRARVWRDQPGRLAISADGITFTPDKGKSPVRVALADIHKADLSRPDRIRIETYDRVKWKAGTRREHVFRLREAVHGAPLARFFEGRLARPVVAALFEGEAGAYEIAAYHRHRLGGCHGKLAIREDGIGYTSGVEGESRRWLLRDIESVGSMSAFHLRVTTAAETYNLDLKERLAPERYEALAQRVLRLNAP